MAMCAFVSGQPALAADATWLASPTDGNFNNSSNWDGGVVPNGTVTFDASSTTSLTFSSNTSVDAFTFGGGAPAYDFTIASGRTLNFNGAGISGGGDVTFSNSGGLGFYSNASADQITLINAAGAGVEFVGPNASSAEATITNSGYIVYGGGGNAWGTAITNNSGGTIEFFANAWMGSQASLTNSGTVSFYEFSDAAGIITNDGLVRFFGDSSANSTRFINNAGGTVDISGLALAGTTAGSIEGAGDYVLGSKTLTVGSNNLSTTVSGVISGTGGSLTKTGNGTLTLSGANTYTGATTVSGGTLEISGSIASSTVSVNASRTLRYIGTANAGSTTITNSGNLQFYNSSTAGSTVITNNSSVLFDQNSSAGSATFTNNGSMQFNTASSAGSALITNNIGSSLVFQNSSAAGNATITNNSDITFFSSSSAETANITNNDTVTFGNTSTASDATITTTNGGVTIFILGSRGGAARFVTNAGGTFDISGLSSSGTTAGSIEGGGDYVLGNKNLEVGSNDLSTTVSGVISGVGGSLTKTGSGTLNLTGTNTYTGATDVDDATLRVNGSIATSNLTTINSGATLGGTGILGNTTISGGTLAPGNSIGTITVNGNLALGPGSLYLVEVSPTEADRTNVTGTATLDGTVTAVFEAGSYMDNSYTILSAAGGLGGSTFGSLNTINLPAGFEAELDYSGGDVLLNLTATAGGSGGALLARNQQSVLNSIVDFFDGGGSLPAGFVTVLGLSGGELSTALSQISGETTAAAQQGATQAMNQFLGAMFDPMVTLSANQSFPPSAASQGMAVPISYAKEEVQRSCWNAWGSAYGGVNGTDGDPNTGSHGMSSRIYGFAAGMDCQSTPDTSIGFGIAGGGTSWNVSDGLGGGESRDFQLGLNSFTRWDDFYAAMAAAYGFHDMSTSRAGFGGDRLTAEFGAHSLGARLEGGTRFPTEFGGMIPYAALQAQSFYTPRYTEDDPGGSGFGLSYEERNVVTLRGEVGSRFKRSVWLDYETMLDLSARLAYARNWMSDPALSAAFQSLPGASFTVNGAAPPKNIALISLGGGLRLPAGVTLSTRFDGEFAGGYATYGGMASIRLNW
jgi:autotransporter-associated beta strand protein